MYRTKGPITGEHLEIPMLGIWVNEDDAYELIEIKIPYFCHRSRRNLEIHPVFELSYSEDQFRTKPSN